MNKEWSEKNKQMQQLLKKATFPLGIRELIALRNDLMAEMLSWQDTLSKADFCAQPFPNADGYHSKTISYSLWHIFRIEDIVVHTLICRDEEVFFAGGYDTSIHAPIITTGNELHGTEIADFSEKLDMDALYDYILSVKNSTDSWLQTIGYTALKTRYDESDKAAIRELQVVSPDEDAAWLIDYWCSRDLKGLIQMPMSRHWIMHIEGALRIIRKIKD